VSSVEPEDDANQLDGGKECVSEAVVARGDGAEVLEFVKEPFDEVALAIQGEAGGSLLKAICLGRDDWLYAPLLKGVDQRIGIVGFFSQERFGGDLIQQRLGLTDAGKGFHAAARCAGKRRHYYRAA
jgi:hypothetical protein